MASSASLSNSSVVSNGTGSVESSSGDSTAEYIVGYVMLAICGIFFVISAAEIVIKTTMRIIKKRQEARGEKLEEQSHDSSDIE